MCEIDCWYAGHATQHTNMTDVGRYQPNTLRTTNILKQKH